jgi:four helix bundle protein
MVSKFEDLLVWQKARQFSVAIYRASDSGQFSRDYGLRDQIRRAAVSVMSNIAEGFARYQAPEVHRFAVIARGSLAEVRSQLYLALDLGYLSPPLHRSLASQCSEVDRLLSAYRRSVKSVVGHR